MTFAPSATAFQEHDVCISLQMGGLCAIHSVERTQMNFSCLELYSRVVATIITSRRKKDSVPQKTST